MIQNVVLYVAYAILSATAIILLKTTSTKIEWRSLHALSDFKLVAAFLTAAGLYMGSFAVWVAVLARSDVTTAYPVCFGLTMVASTVLAVVFLSEPLNVLKILGMVLMFVSAILLTR